MKHTPTPWRMIPGQPIGITDSNKREIAYVPVCMTDCDEAQAYADAKHIVRCVNGHDELVDRLERAMSHIDADEGASARVLRDMITETFAKLNNEIALISE